MKTKTCKYCGKEFEGQRSAQYCSDKCRLYAWRKRKIRRSAAQEMTDE